MLHRVVVPFLVLGAILAGYLAAGRPARAQVAPLPFDVGEEVTLTYESDRSTSCIVAEIRGIYLRCDAPGRTRIGAQPPERWQSLEGVRTIERRLR